MKQVRNQYPWLTPGGLGVVILCFFLPWAKIGCAGGKSSTGADLAEHAGLLWIVLIAATVALVAYLVFQNQGSLAKAKSFSLWGPLIGLAAIVIEYIRYLGGVKTDMGVLQPSDIGLEFQIGFFGTLGGFIAAIIGSLRTGKAPAESARQDESPGARASNVTDEPDNPV